jgi:hypothetical protein
VIESAAVALNSPDISRRAYSRGDGCGLMHAANCDSLSVAQSKAETTTTGIVPCSHSGRMNCRAIWCSRWLREMFRRSASSL